MTRVFFYTPGGRTQGCCLSIQGLEAIAAVGNCKLGSNDKILLTLEDAAWEGRPEPR